MAFPVLNGVLQRVKQKVISFQKNGRIKKTAILLLGTGMGCTIASAPIFLSQNSSGLSIDAVKDEMNKLRQKASSMSPQDKMIFSIIGTNIAVFGLWRVPALQGFLSRHFLLSLENLRHGRIHTLLTSAFSHHSFPHLAFNMIAFYSFAPTMYKVTSPYDSLFLTLYLGGGLSCSIFSLLNKSIRSLPSSSLGASGCVYSVLFAFGLLFPQAQLGIIFIPFVSFSAFKGLCGLAAFDTLGLLFRRIAIFDHAGHIGGAIFGSAFVFGAADYLRVKPNPDKYRLF